MMVREESGTRLGWCYDGQYRSGVAAGSASAAEGSTVPNSVGQKGMMEKLMRRGAGEDEAAAAGCVVLI